MFSALLLLALSAGVSVQAQTAQSYKAVVTFSTAGCTSGTWSSIKVDVATSAAACAPVACAAGTGDAASTGTQTFCFTSAKALTALAGPSAATIRTAYADQTACTAAAANTAVSKTWELVAAGQTCAAAACTAAGVVTSCEVAASVEDLTVAKLTAAAPYAYTLVGTFSDNRCLQDKWTTIVSTPVALGGTACAAAACAAVANSNPPAWSQTFCSTNAKFITAVAGPRLATIRTTYANADCTGGTVSKSWTFVATGQTCAAATCASGVVVSCEPADSVEDITAAKIGAGSSYTAVGTFSAAGCAQTAWTSIDVRPVAPGATCAPVACSAAAPFTQTFCFTSTKGTKDLAGPKLSTAKTTYATNDACTAAAAGTAQSKKWDLLAAGTTCTAAACATGVLTACETSDSVEDVTVAKLVPMNSFTVVGTFSAAGCTQDRWTSMAVTAVAAGAAACAPVACTTASPFTQTFCMSSSKTLDLISGPKSQSIKEVFTDTTACAANTLTSRTWMAVAANDTCKAAACSAGSLTKCESATSTEDLSLTGLKVAAAPTSAAPAATGTTGTTSSAVPLVSSTWVVTTAMIALSLVLSSLFV